MGILKEAKTTPFEAVVTAEMKWRCLGAGCPSSCCDPYAARISIQEIVPLSKHFPVVFAEIHPEEGGPYLDICILMKVDKADYCACLEEGSGCVLGEGRPVTCKQYPFSVTGDQNGEIKIRVKMSCPGFSETDGHPVIMPDKSITPELEQQCVGPAISKLDMLEETRKFVDLVNSLNLIVDGQYNYKGESISFKLVDAKKLYALPPQVLQDLRDWGYMELLRVHMNSLVGNFNRLIDIYLEKAAKDDNI